MGLADAIERQRTYRRPGPRCKVCSLLDTLNADDKAALVAALNDPGVQSRAISDALAEEQHTVGQHVVARHRRGDCAG